MNKKEQNGTKKYTNEQMNKGTQRNTKEHKGTNRKKQEEA